jgi:hypothetical protein
MNPKVVNIHSPPTGQISVAVDKLPLRSPEHQATCPGQASPELHRNEGLFLQPGTGIPQGTLTTVKHGRPNITVSR